MTDDLTNGYFNIKAIETITHTSNSQDEYGECLEEKEVYKEITLLQYNGTTYVESK